MTIINSLEIDNIEYIEDNIKSALKKNKQIESKLNVLIVISNCSQFATRYILAKEFIQRIKKEENKVNLYVVELAYYNQKYQITNKNNKKHLQLRSNIPLWHKENMINIGVEKLLPKDWKSFAYIDADVEFESIHWVTDTLKLLNDDYDIIQMFSHAIDMDKRQNAMNIFSSFGYQYTHKKPWEKNIKPINQFHPGYAWAMSRKAYEQMNGLYEFGIIGSGDHIMALSYIKKGLKGINEESTDGYKLSITDFQTRCKGLSMGYLPTVIRHHFHGTKQNRQYESRWKILVKYNYDPLIHVKKNKDGILIPTDECPKEMLNEIIKYFNQRLEDDFS